MPHVSSTGAAYSCRCRRCGRQRGTAVAEYVAASGRQPRPADPAWLAETPPGATCVPVVRTDGPDLLRRPARRGPPSPSAPVASAPPLGRFSARPARVEPVAGTTFPAACLVPVSPIVGVLWLIPDRGVDQLVWALAGRPPCPAAPRARPADARCGDAATRRRKHLGLPPPDPRAPGRELADQGSDRIATDRGDVELRRVYVADRAGRSRTSPVTRGGPVC